MSIPQAILSAVLLVTLVGAAPNSANYESPNTNRLLRADPKDYRLPLNVEPVSYNLKFILPNLEDDNFGFSGEAEIKIKVSSSTEKSITLHAKHLEILDIPFITNEKNEKIPALSKPKSNQETDLLKIDFEKAIPAGTYTLSIKYKGEINDELEGFYRSNYTTTEGKLVSLATTHFEPVGARRAFPCFDEPSFKATFKISIKHREDYEAISNMHFIQIENDGDQTWTHFAETPIMSTYLIAFVVSDFAKLINDKNDFHVYARKDVINHGRFALNKGQKSLEELQIYTGYPQGSIFKRMQCIAVPHLRAGAMENWGLITYSEGSLLVEEGVSTTRQTEDVVSVIAHELAHQWFGNLVSPKWWDQVWLNEGFANYFQYFIPNKDESTWRFMDMLVIESLQGKAFPADSQITAVAMNHKVNSPKEIQEKFNAISYSKAGAIIRMISHILKEDRFREALKSYLSKNEYKAVTSKELFDEFKTKFSGTLTITQQDFVKALENWESKPGYPIITVERDYAKNTSTVQQERYLLGKSETPNTDKYWVALNYAQTKRSFGNTEPRYWMKPDDNKKTIPITNSYKWVIFNVQQTGYYRVNYDEKNWNLIIDGLKSAQIEDIHVLNRAQLVDDALNLARISKLNYTIALKVASYLKNESDYLPWKAAFNGFSFIYKQLANTEYHKSFKDYILELVAPVEISLKYDSNSDDEHLTKYHRVEVQKWACMVGSTECNKDASAKLDKWLEKSFENPLPVDARDIILCAGIRNADQEKWDQLFDKYLETKEEYLLNALGCSSNEIILKNYLNMAINGSIFITNRGAVISSVYSGSTVGINIALDFVIEKYQVISTMMGSKDAFKKFVKNFGTMLTTREQISKLQRFGDASKDVDIMETVKAGIEEAKINADWVEKYGVDIGSYFPKPAAPVEPPSGTTSSGAISVFSALLLLVSLTASQIIW